MEVPSECDISQVQICAPEGFERQGGGGLRLVLELQKEVERQRETFRGRAVYFNNIFLLSVTPYFQWCCDRRRV